VSRQKPGFFGSGGAPCQNGGWRPAATTGRWPAREVVKPRGQFNVAPNWLPIQLYCSFSVSENLSFLAGQ
jgi:hypothetical protein